MPLTGNDTSHWQGTPDFAAFRASGGAFSFAKATESTTYVDPMFSTSRAHAKVNGLVFGSYHFARLTSASAEAAFFLAHAGPERGELAALDMEIEVPGVDPVAWSVQWLTQVKAACGGTPPGIYLNQFLLGKYDWRPVLALNCWLWEAKYDNLPQSQPTGSVWPFTSIKQYTSTGAAAGVAGACDLDEFYGDLPTLQRYTIGYQAVPTPPPPPKPTPPPKPVVLHPPVFAWNLGPGNYYGNIAGPANCHGGVTAAERTFVQNIQRWLIFHGVAHGHYSWTWATNTWADGVWGPETDTAMAAWHQRFYAQPAPTQCWSDDYRRLAVV